MSLNKQIRRLVVKFGGSSLSNGKRIRKAAKAVANQVYRGVQVAVVVSAMGGVTDLLIQEAEDASKGKIRKEELDDLLSMGERTSARLFSAVLKSLGIKSHYFDPADENWPIITNGHFTNADPVVEECNLRVKKYLTPLLDENVVPVVPGFIGKTFAGKVTTMGRGGSDTTAFVLANALEADEVVLVTDVGGIMSADPKIVENPRKLRVIDVEQLAELADLGAKFIHQKSLQYKDRKINVVITSCSRSLLDEEGTLLVGSFPEVSVVLNNPLKAMRITVIGKNLSQEVRILKEIIQTLSDHQITPFGMTTSENSITIFTPEAKSKEPLEFLHRIALTHEQGAMAFQHNLALIQVKGVSFEKKLETTSKLLESLQKEGISAAGFLSTNLGILFFVEWNARKKVVDLFNKVIDEIYASEKFAGKRGVSANFAQVFPKPEYPVRGDINEVHLC